MTKMAAMQVWGKLSLNILIFKTKGPILLMSLGLGFYHLGCGWYKNMFKIASLGWPWPSLTFNKEISWF